MKKAVRWTILAAGFVAAMFLIGVGIFNDMTPLKIAASIGGVVLICLCILLGSIMTHKHSGRHR